MIMTKVIVIGGGASGLISAICASRNGLDVTILEKTDRIGKKILATGNGRCNLTNINCNINRFHGNDSKFALGALNVFDQHYAISFFEELGISHKVEDLGRVFPESEQASSVLDVIRMEIKHLGIQILANKEVQEITKNKKFAIKCADDTRYTCDKVIVATGGKATPKLGSDGSGIKILSKLGHNIVKPFPSLVHVILETNILSSIKGVKVQGAVTVRTNKVTKKEYGEILFTADGISGPPVFQISRIVSKAEQENIPCTVIIDSFPKYTKEDLIVNLQMRMAYRPNKTLEEFLIGLINKKLIRVILKQSGLSNVKRKCNTLSEDEVNSLASTMKEWSFKVLGTRSWSNAQVMAGGVDTGDIDPQTLESRKVPGLYVTGELLDIDGDCGGFNLQWAWSSGYVAGNSILN